MQLTFKQGIVRQQQTGTGSPAFLQKTPSGINVIVSPDPLVVTLAHGSVDYLHQESSPVTNAWPGPFPSSNDYWLYIDIDILTGTRTFGKITKAPTVSGTAPAHPTPQINDHWFDPVKYIMKYWNGTGWIEVIRVFVAQLENGSILTQYPLGSSVGLNIASRSGFIIFDDEEHPVKKFDRFNRGKFITTETPLASQFARITNYRLEGSITTAQAIEPIAKYNTVTLHGPGQIVVAKNTDIHHPAIGVASEDMHTGEVRSYIISGYIAEDTWNWTAAPGTPLFVSPNGLLTLTVPQSDSIQQVAIIIDSKTIFVSIQRLIRYE
jgi:hypothetical protein